MMATMNERSSMPTGGITRRSGAMTGSVTSASMRVMVHWPLGSNHERSARPMSAKVRSCKSCQQNAEDGFRHIVAVLVMPAWVSGGRIATGVSSIEPK